MADGGENESYSKRNSDSRQSRGGEGETVEALYLEAIATIQLARNDLVECSYCGNTMRIEVKNGSGEFKVKFPTREGG